MIRYCQGDLLEADVDALVNAVNTVGVMGKGIALAFKSRFPANFQAFAAACPRGEVVTGRVFVTEAPALGAGLGGLRWPAVRAEIEAALADWPVDVRVYEPLRAASPA